jgi:hypothetical protein
LRQAQVAVDVAEQGGGRAKAIPVRDGGRLTRLPVIPRNTECAVALLADRGSALAVWGFRCGRVHHELPLVPRIASSHPLGGELLELSQRCAGHSVDVPGLRVRSRRRPCCGGQHALQHLCRQRPVGEAPHCPSARDRLIDVQDRLPAPADGTRRRLPRRCRVRPPPRRSRAARC